MTSSQEPKSVPCNENQEGYPYYKNAEILIDGAIKFYYEEQNYICAIALAGSADSLLSSIIEHMKRTNWPNIKSLLDILNSPEKKESQAAVEYLKHLKKSGSLPKKEKETDDEYERRLIADSMNSLRNALKHYREESCGKEYDIKIGAENEIFRAIQNFFIITKNCEDTGKRSTLPMDKFIKDFYQKG